MELSERKRAEETLASREALYRTLIETIPHVIWFAESDGQITFLNKAWYDLTGRKPEDTLESRSRWAEALHPDDREMLLGKWE